MYRVEIDAGLCIGSSNCAEEAPDAYEVDDTGVAVLLTPTAPDARLLSGAVVCPVDAIRVYAADGARIHP